MSAPASPSVTRLTTEQLDALPVGAVVRFLDDPGRRHVVAFKERCGCGCAQLRWLLSDGGAFSSSDALADIGAVLHDPAPPVSDEAEVRERIAQEIEAAVVWHARVGPGAENEIFRTGMRSAARIVRGTAR